MKNDLKQSLLFYFEYPNVGMIPVTYLTDRNGETGYNVIVDW